MADPQATAFAVDAYLGAESDTLGAQARASMNNSVSKDSAFEADLRGVAQRTGVPVDTVRSYPQEMKQQDAMRAYDFNQLAREYPRTSRFLANEENAAVAHKDVGLLKSIEGGVGSLLSYAMGNGPGDGFIGTMRAAPYTAASGFAGVKRAAVDVVEPWASFITQDKDNIFARSSAQYKAQASVFNAQAKELNPSSGGLVSDGVRSGVDSLLQNSKYMALALVPGGQPFALAGFGMEAFGASYNKAADKNVPLIPRITYAASDGVIEFGTERGPMGALIQNIKAGTPLFLAIVRNAWRENKGEQVATALQDLNEWAVIQPVGTPFTDYVKERPAAAVQTLIATLVGSAGNTVITRGMQGAADVVDGRDRQAEYAMNAHGLLTEMQKTVEASEIIKHSSGTLNAYMQSLVEDSGVENVYLDSAKLVAAGVDLQALAQELPSVATQLAQVENGGDLVIPTAELLSLSSAYGQPLMDHARTDPNGMSRSEAQTYMQEKGDTLTAEIDRVLAEQDNDQEFKAGRDRVQVEILTQLNEVKRFTSAVNTQYATLAANFYAVMAARSGMTVTQFAQTYQLGFSGQTQAGAQVLGQYDQGDVAATEQMDEGTGLPLNADGTVTLYHHTSAANAAAIKESGQLRSAAEPSVYLTTRETADTGYGDTVVKVRIDPTKLQADDQFPDGRVDYRVDVSRPGGSLGDASFSQGEVKSAQSPYENDLFGNPLPAPTGKRGSAARRAGAEAGDVQPTTAVQDTQAPPGEYHVRTVVGSETRRKLGASQITTASELAQATAYLYRSAVERFDGIVTDAAGKPLGVIGGFKGAIAQTSVYPGTLVAEAVRIPGAAHVWFSHNHPSGISELSTADLKLTQALADVFNGSGIEPMGLMAVSGKEFSFTTNGLGVLDRRQSFDAPTTEVSVPVIEREQVAREGELVIVTSPDSAKRIAAEYYAQAKVPGIILLTSQNHVAAWVPLQPKMLGKLRDTGGLNAIYRAISESNPGAAIIVHGGELSKKGDLSTGTISANIAAALAKADVRTLDSINAVTMESAAEQSGDLVANTLQQEARGQIAFGNDITQQASIVSMFKAADLSTFIHEGGHFFLEVQADLATRITTRIAQGETVTDGERSILDDMNKTLDWMGVKGSPELSAIDTWYLMSNDEKRPYHEQWARGFEAYAFEGKAPSLDLQHAFQSFRSWLVNVYRAALKSVNAGPADIANAMQVELSDEVRSVMDRMLATSDQIQETEAARNMGPLFASAEAAGMDLEAYRAYHDMGTQATMDATDELQTKGLRDMQWLANAKTRKLRELQKQHDALRAQVAREVRAELMSQPVYRLWTFLTARAGDQVVGDKPAGQSKGVNPEVDNIFTAIAKMGGLSRAEVKSQWGIDEKEKLESGVFGSPVVRKDGGVSMDAMAENLVGEGYIIEGRNGQTNMEQLEALFDDQRGGIDRFSVTHDMNAAYGDAPLDVPDLPEMGYGKLRTQELRDTYGLAEGAAWRKLSEMRMTSDSTGLHPDVVAEMFEFSSADHMVQALLAADTPRAAVEGRTDQRMLEENGDLATPAGLLRAADAAVHNDARMRFVATELRAIQHAMSVREKVPGQRNTVDVLARAAKEYAAEIIARLRVRDIRPAQYTAAEVRASKAAQKATGDLAEQAMQKRNQLINMHAAKAAYAAQDEVKAAILYFRKFDTTSKTLDPEYRGQIEAMLERFDLRASTSLKEIAKRKTLAEWMDSQAKLGLEPDIPSDLLDEANRKSFKDMTVEEVRGLRETIQQIEHLGRLKHRLLTAKDKRDFDLIVAEAGESIRANGGELRPIELEQPTGIASKLEWFAAGHRKFASLLRQMDGNVDAGPLWRILGRTMNESGSTEAVMIEQATVKLTEMYVPLLNLKGGVHGDNRFIPEINDSLTRGARISVALNWGNETNRQRVMAGDNWTDAQVTAILRTLSPVELNFVNETWAYINTFWPQIADKQKRVTGVTPEKVEGMPFVLIASDGTSVNMDGGYYPIKYDANRDDRAEKLDAAAVATDMLRGAMTRSTTRRGHTKARVEDVKRPVKKTLDVITQHITEVVHDLSWHEWLIDANRLMDAKPINQAIRAHYGTAILRTMKDTLQGIAAADMIPQTIMDQALLYLRGNISRSVMGVSLTTAFLQPFGLAQSIVRIGPKHVLRGLTRWGGDAARFENSNTWIGEKSDFMRLRSTTFNRELREIRGRISQGHSRARQVYDASLFMMMQKMQLVADVPTWIGAYEKALDGGRDEATAVALADQSVVDSQGGGQTQDMAELQRKHPMLSMFYSYFNTTYNLAAESTAATNFKNPVSFAGWISDMMMLMVIPAIGPAVILDLLRSGGGDDDDAATWAKKLAEWQAGYLLGTMIGLREASGLVAGFDYTGPPAGRIVGDVGKLGKQIGQGEIDEPLVLAAIRLMGAATGIPTVQIIRSYRGWQAWDEGDAPGTALLLGPPPRD